MSYTERIKALAQRVPAMIDSLETEEATKNALIMPFISALGYDVFNPLEVVPEFTADVGTKRGEKVDYAIKRGDEVVMLIEAKRVGSALQVEHASQLYRYFGVTKTRIAVLTNGITYQFFADLDEPNKMDARPFLEIDLRDLRDVLLVELGKLTKSGFNLDDMLSAATDLKHMHEIRRVIEAQIDAPDDDFVRYFFQRANPNGRFTATAREQFSGLVQRAFAQTISDRVGARLRHALVQEDEVSGRRIDPDAIAPSEDAAAASGGSGDGIETTEEELDAYRIVKALVVGVISSERVTYRDAKSYCAVLVDDNNRKPLCRLHFNRAQKYVGTFDHDRNETKHAITALDDLYSLGELLREVAARYRDAEA